MRKMCKRPRAAASPVGERRSVSVRLLQRHVVSSRPRRSGLPPWVPGLVAAALLFGAAVGYTGGLWQVAAQKANRLNGTYHAANQH